MEIRNLKKLILTIMLIVLLSGIASAEQITDWPFGQRNVMPDDITGVYYDFEEGSNCVDFKNQHPDVATFLTVLGTQPYGSDWPSYVTVGGSTCGNTRCYMRIYPWCGNYANGTPYEWVFVVQGRSAFSSMTGPDVMGGFIPGTKARIQFKEGTHYISFLASTGGNMYIRLYDMQGKQYNIVHYEKIAVTILRNGTEPSNFTRFSIHLPNVDIARMDISGPFNGWHIDDMIVGGGPDYLPDEPLEPVDYSDVAELIKRLVGHEVPYLEHGFGFDYRYLDYADPEDIINPPPNCAPGLNCPTGLEYWNQDTRQFEYGEGMSDEGLIIWGFNQIAKELYGESVVKWETAPDMAKHDFTESVPVGEEIPGDVYFMYGGEYGAVDEIGIVVDEEYVVTSRPGDVNEGNGVDYHSKSSIENSENFAGYYRLPGKITGGHTPVKKAPHTKYESPVDYSYVEEKAVELAENEVPIPYNEDALGYDYPTLNYAEPEWLTDDSLDYWIEEEHCFSDVYEAHTGEDIDTSGLSPEGLLLWTYNYDSYNEYGREEVTWDDLPHMIEYEFTESVEPSDIQPGDVYFWDSTYTESSTGEKVPDRAGISVTPNVDDLDQNMITVTPEGGVHYNYGDAVINNMPGFIGIYRIPARTK
ncbi:MAG: hypothetical protein KAS66_03390 [Candidatus Omnitrophica bacterium]|nr:hypothetical protein [Candidatus Omnitrophota bacterium]